MPATASPTEQEREAVELFSRADRRAQVTSSIVRFIVLCSSPPLPALSFSFSHTRASFLVPPNREEKRCFTRSNFPILRIRPSRVSLRRTLQGFSGRSRISRKMPSTRYTTSAKTRIKTSVARVAPHSPYCPHGKLLTLCSLFSRSESKGTKLLSRCPRNSPPGWRGTWTCWCNCSRAVSPHPMDRIAL